MAAPEKGWEPYAEARSLETLGEHAADVMFFLAFDGDEGGASAEFADFMSQPGVGALPVAQAGQIVEIDATRMVGTSWAKATEGLEMIAEVIGRGDLNRDLVQE
jgi:ABC-type Fe3+-hydroxamate transport system substrate-binding protein